MYTENQRRLDTYVTGLPQFRRPAPPITEMFVVASGPSIKQQDLSHLPPGRTIAVNRSFEVVRSDYVYIMDDRLVSWILADQFNTRYTFLASTAVNVMPSPLGPRSLEQLQYPVKYVPRQIEASVPTANHAGIYCGCNSGFGAVQLACWMGARTINLLGFDMHANNGTHFHGGYSTTQEERYHEKLAMFRLELENFAPRYAAAGIEVFNLSPNSALHCFKRKNLPDVL